MITLGEAFESFKVSAWRLEARDTYSVPDYDEAMDAFLAGRPLPPRTDGWEETVRSAVERGARIGRIRLVGHPISDYTQFEFALYPANVTSGEDVRIVDRTWLDGSWSAAPDAWLFDNELAFRMDYDPEGAFLEAVQVASGPIVEMRRRLTSYAVSLSDYRLTEVPSPRPALAVPAAMPEEVSG